ncbi:MAG: YbaK/EbsC family protein [Ignavibacteriae bacterium]|nr:deacylase [Ignavibacteriota bacterium]NOG98131.1 YbaK/EbsC family protein [Ignavibacteriota bacterium]
MPAKKLKDFLDSNDVKYVSVSHSKAYTAQEIAASAHIPGKELAKTVMIKIDGHLAMAVLPASYKVDFALLQKTLGADRVRLAYEQEFKDRCSDCEVGAMPPFGNLYNLDVYVAQSLTEDEEIAFNAGTHTELIKMKYEDYERIVSPKILMFSTKVKT